MLRRSNRIAWSAIHLRVDGGVPVLHLHQLEVDANCVVLIEKCGDLFLELRAAIHAREVERAQHLSRAVALQSFGHLAQQLRRIRLRERRAWLLSLRLGRLSC